MELIQSLLESVHNTLIDTGLNYFRYTILSFLLFWILFKERLAHFRIQPRPRVKPQIIIKEIGYSCSTLLIAGTGLWILNPIVFQHRHGLFYDNDYPNISDYGWGYFFLSIFLMLVIDDTYFYWMHRLIHHPKIYNYVHKIHHQSTDTTPFTTYSFHPLEAVIFFFGQILVISIIPVHNLAVTIWASLTLLNSIVIHLGYEIYPNWFTNSWLTNCKTPSTHHNIHHEKAHGNYALIFTWWDKLMKTESPDYQKKLEAVQQRKLLVKKL